jgi:hypothetical protein
MLLTRPFFAVDLTPTPQML